MSAVLQSVRGAQARPTPPPRPSRAPSASELVDVLIASLLGHRAAAVWVEPEGDRSRPDIHRASLERGRHVISAALLRHGLGDAVIARLALLCDLDLLAPGTQTGRCSVVAGDRHAELVLTISGGRGALSAEARLIDIDEGTRLEQEIVQRGPLPDRLVDGTTLGPYTIRDVLGAGGMGIVYRAEHALLGRRVAIKVLRRSVLRDDPDSARRFLREARAAARIHSPDIVEVMDYGTLGDGRPYLVMELLEGRSLSDVMRSDAMAPSRALALARHVASALAAVHAAGVVHRDLTPSNLFVHEEGDEELVKLVDFGTASLADPEAATIPDGPPGMVLGTPFYMAPEQACGQATDHRTDLYALGVVLFQMLTGKVPFGAPTPREVLYQHVRDEPPTVTSPFEPLPPLVTRIVGRMLRKAPEERYQQAADLVADIDEALATMTRTGWRRWLPL